jgi:hypothetical protein
MRTQVMWTVIIVCGLTASAWAQMPAGSDKSSPPETKKDRPSVGDTENAAPHSKGAAPEKKPTGDVLTLKNGQVISGFQILKETPTEYVLDILDGVITLSVPRRQVISVRLDDIKPGETKPNKGKSPESSEPSLISISGQRVSAELQEKLNADISDPPMEYKDADLVDVLGDLNKRFGVVVMDDTIKGIPPTARKGSLSSKPGQTLMSLLKDELLQAFPNIETVILTDKVVIATKEGAAKLKSQNASETQAAGQPAPPASTPAQPSPGPAAGSTNGKPAVHAS